MRRTPIAIVALLALSGGLLAGCGSSAPASSQGTDSAMCQAEASLKTSISGLLHGGVIASGKSGIKASISQIQSDLTALRSAANGTASTQAEALSNSVHTLAGTIQGLTSSTFIASVPTITSEISSVGTAASSLYTTLRHTCG